MKLKFKDVLSNPFRDLKANPLIENKIQELMASINLTGYWNNCVVTKRDGKYCLAYGHHRIEAAKRCGLTEADFIIMDLDDAKLIQILDNENRETYGSSPASVIESVKAVVAALAEGTIPAFEVDPKTNAKHIRFAPSYVAGKPAPVADARAYTSTLIAEFLGRVYSNGRADTSVEASLNFLHLKELGAINNSVLVKNNQPITARKLFDITADIKQRTEIVQERRGKTQQELAVLRAKQIEAQAKAKADSDKAEAEHKALVKKLADAQREANDRKADALKAEIKAKDERAKAKEVLNNLRRSEFDAQIQAKKDWESSQRVQDTYLPIRRDVEAMIGKLEMLVSEHNPFRELVKNLSTRKGITDVDKQRIRRALMDVSNWYADWAAPQFAPEMKAAQKRAVEARKATETRPKGKGGA